MQMLIDYWKEILKKEPWKVTLNGLNAKQERRGGSRIGSISDFAHEYV